MTLPQLDITTEMVLANHQTNIFKPLKQPISAMYECFLKMREKLLEQDGILFTLGCGGSAADAEHIVGELLKEFKYNRPTPVNIKQEWERGKATFGLLSLCEGIRAMALTGPSSIVTAMANDVGFTAAFAQMVYVMACAHRPHANVLLCISTSGNSKAVIEAARVAHLSRVFTVGLTGTADNVLAQYTDYCIQVPGETTAEIQQNHAVIYHFMCELLEVALIERGRAGVL